MTTSLNTELTAEGTVLTFDSGKSAGVVVPIVQDYSTERHYQ